MIGRLIVRNGMQRIVRAIIFYQLAFTSIALADENKKAESNEENAVSIATRAGTKSTAPTELRSKEQLDQLLETIDANVRKVSSNGEGPRLYEIPGWFLVKGRLPGKDVKAPEFWDAGWYSFSIMQSWPDFVFNLGDRVPTVIAIGHLYYQPSYVYRKRSPTERRLAIASTVALKDGDHVPAAFNLKIDHYWLKIPFDTRAANSSAEPQLPAPLKMGTEKSQQAPRPAAVRRK